ncbi:MAG: sulfatase-like hydrolase/transferase [Opitutae bacterium]|nr:sulfatase-like hydrolase/transferase [Opitutae bacterium]
MKTILTFFSALLPIALLASQPNIVFLLSDDQSWSGLSVAMHDQVPESKGDLFHTPNLEKLAAQGMRFSAAYSPASVCSPTRVSLQTGKSPARMRWTKAAPTMRAEDGFKLIPPAISKNLSIDEVTIAEMLKTAGYATAHYGKWHLAGDGPGKHGYDEHDGDTGNKDAAPFKDPNPVDIFGMGRRANAFMEKSVKTGKPFFIQLSYHALHYPENAFEETKQKYFGANGGRDDKRILRAAITEDLDTGVGLLMDDIERLGIGGNTYLIYMADNGASGGGGKKGGLRGGKGGVWEGGIRVPLIIRGPGIKPNSFCHSRVVGYDFFPTFCELAGVKQALPEGIEGGSILPLLATGKGEVKRPRQELVFHFPHYQGDTPHSAIFLGNLKMMKFYETGKLSLFDLSKDLFERNDLSASMPEETIRLHNRLNLYLDLVGAELPKANPKYDPANPPEMSKGKGKKGDKGGGKKGGKGEREKAK